MNGNTSFTKNVFLLELITDVPFNNYVIKADDVNLILSRVIFKGDTVQDAVFIAK